MESRSSLAYPERQSQNLSRISSVEKQGDEDGGSAAEAQFALLGQLSDRVSLLEREQNEGARPQRDDVEDALQAVDDFRVGVGGTNQKRELLSASESLVARLEALLASSRPPVSLDLPGEVLVEMPLTPEADSIIGLPKSGDPRLHFIMEVTSDADGGAAVTAEDVEKEYSISVPVTPMPAAPAPAHEGEGAEELPLPRTICRAGQLLSEDKPESTTTMRATGGAGETETPASQTQAPIDEEKGAVIADDPDERVKSNSDSEANCAVETKDYLASSETADATRAGDRDARSEEEKESPLPSSCVPSDREVGGNAEKTSAKKSAARRESFPVSDEGSSSLPSDFRAPMMTVVAKRAAESDDLTVFKAVLEEGDVEFNVTTEKAEGLWKEPEEDLGLLDLDWEKDDWGDGSGGEDDVGGGDRKLLDDEAAVSGSKLDLAFQRLSPGISDEDSAEEEEPLQTKEFSGTDQGAPPLQKDSSPVPDSSAHDQGTT